MEQQLELFPTAQEEAFVAVRGTVPAGLKRYERFDFCTTLMVALRGLLDIERRELSDQELDEVDAMVDKLQGMWGVTTQAINRLIALTRPLTPTAQNYLLTWLGTFLATSPF